MGSFSSVPAKGPGGLPAKETDRLVIRKLLVRRVPHFVGGYLGTSWILLESTAWAVNQYGLSAGLSNFVVATLLIFLPTVVVLSWRHGAPGDDGWTKVDGAVVLANLMVAGGFLATAPLGGIRDWARGDPGGLPQAEISYIVLEYTPADASESDKLLSRRAARILRRLLERWNTVTVVPDMALDGPRADFLAAGVPQSSFAMGTDLAHEFGADYLVQVQASDLRELGAPHAEGLTGEVEILTVLSSPSSGNIVESMQGNGPVDSLGAIMTTMAMQLLVLPGEPADYGLLFARSSDHRAVQELEAGREALRRWRLAEAHRRFEAAIARDSTFPLAHHLLAQTMYWELAHDDERLQELGPLIDHHSAKAERAGQGNRLRPGERRAVEAFRAFWMGDYDLARARYDSLIGFELADIESIVLRGAVEIEDPILIEREDGSLLPRQNLNLARAMFDTAAALAPMWELSWGHLHAIDWEVAESAYKGAAYGFELPGDEFVLPYEVRETAEQRWFCLAVQADTIAWVLRGPCACSADTASRAAAAEIQSRTVERLDRATRVELDQARHHDELAEFLMWKQSLSGCDGDPRGTDSLTRMARRHLERAVEMRRDTTPQDRIRLASLYLGNGDLESALAATDRALDGLPGWESWDGTPPSEVAANPYLAAGRANPAVAILDRVFGESTSGLTDPQDCQRSISTNRQYATLQALLALGTLGETGSEVTDRIGRLWQAWSDSSLLDRDRVALRLASLPYVGPALAHSPGEWEEWFDDWDQHGLEVPPVWQGMFAAYESPPDLEEAMSRLNEAVEALGADPDDGPVSPKDLYLPIVLAESIGATTVQAELRGRLSRCVLRLDTFDAGWAMRSSLGMID